MKSNKGIALILVLILVALATLGVTSALRSSAAQLNFTQRHYALEQAEQAAESAIQCVFSHVDMPALQVWMSYFGPRPAFNDLVDNGLAGCGNIATHAIQLHHFNSATAQTYTEYCGIVDDPTISDPDLLQTHQFQTWAMGKSAAQNNLSVKVVQGWRITLPKDESKLLHPGENEQRIKSCGLGS